MLPCSDLSDTNAGGPPRRAPDGAASLDSDALLTRVVASLTTASGGLRADEVANAVGITVLESWSLLTTLERSGTVRRVGSLWVHSAGDDARERRALFPGLPD